MRRCNHHYTRSYANLSFRGSCLGLCSGDLASCRVVVDSLTAVHVDDQFDVRGDVPGCLKPEVQECRRSRQILIGSIDRTAGVTTYKHTHINRTSQTKRPRFHEKHVHQNKSFQGKFPRALDPPQERDQLKVAAPPISPQSTRATTTAREIAKYKFPQRKSP